MSFGAIYCESWFGLRNASNSWGMIYPFCGGITADSTEVTSDSTLFTADEILVDTTSVVSMEITSGDYSSGDDLPLEVTFSEIVDVDTTGGNPTIDVDIDSNTREFDFSSGSGTEVLTFDYTLVNEDQGFTSVAVASDIETNGGSLTSQDGDPVETDTGSIIVDIDGVTSPDPSPVGPITPVGPNYQFVTVLNSSSINYTLDVLLKSGNQTRHTITPGASKTFNNCPDWGVIQNQNLVFNSVHFPGVSITLVGSSC